MVSSKVHSGDLYRIFLQGALSRRVMTERVTKALWAASVEAITNADPSKEIGFGGSDEEWDAFLNKIQEILDPLDLEFAHVKDEKSGTVMYAITNTKSDEASQIASDYSTHEVAFFKAIVEQIMLAPKLSFSISSLAALREVSYIKPGNMTKAQGELVLSSFVARGWLSRSRRGRYSLGTRTLLELKAYLTDTYEDELIECTICQEIVTSGLRCATQNCQVYLHTHCNAIYRRTGDASSRKCPACQSQWVEGQSGVLPVGEDAVRDGPLEQRRTRARDGDGDDAEDEEANEDETQQTQPTSQSQPRKERKRKGKRAPSQRATGQSRRGKASDERSDETDEEIAEDLYADDDDAVDIDDLTQIRADAPSATSRTR